MSKYLGSILRRSLLAGAAGLGLMGGVFSNIRIASAGGCRRTFQEDIHSSAVRLAPHECRP